MKPDYTFWKKIKAEREKSDFPFFVLAPMADVTDIAFRSMFAKYGKPDVTWTEFVSADGLSSPGREVLKRDLEFTEAERPVVAQIFGNNPETIKNAVTLCKDLGFDGVDINMGCPVDAIGRQGAGAALIKNPEVAKSVIRAAKEAAGDMPVSVKTRIGYNKIEYKEWLTEVLKEKPAALSIHLRTRKEMSAVPAHWELAGEIADFVRSLDKEVVLLANGDVHSREDGIAKEKESRKESFYDGIMVGRGVFGNPYFFNKEISFQSLPLSERFAILLEHTRLFQEKLGDIKNFSIMKKHYKAYVSGFDGAKELRILLMEEKEIEGIEKLLMDFLKNTA